LSISLLAPGHRQNVVNVCVLVFVAVSIHLIIAAKESPLVKSVLLGHVASLADLVQLRVENVRA